MKKTTKLALLTTLGLTLAGLTARAQSEPTAPEPPHSPPEPPHAPPPLSVILPGLLDKYDINKDGQLDQNELATLKQHAQEGKLTPPSPPSGRGPRGPGFGPGQAPKETLDKYDANKDGKLDENERAALQKDIQKGKIQPPFGRGQRGPGFGPPPSAKSILERFDADKDGKLDETELDVFLKSMPRRAPMGAGSPGAPPPQQ